MGIGLGVLFGIGLPGVVGSGLVGLPGLGGKEVTSECSEEDSLSVLSDDGGVGEGDPLVSLSKGVEGGRSLDSVGDFGLGGASLAVGLEDEVDGVSVSFHSSFRVLSHLFWRGVNLESSLSRFSMGVGFGGLVGGQSLVCLGG